MNVDRASSHLQFDAPPTPARLKIVVRSKRTNRTIQIHERYANDSKLGELIALECANGFSVTVTQL